MAAWQYNMRFPQVTQPRQSVNPIIADYLPALQARQQMDAQRQQMEMAQRQAIEEQRKQQAIGAVARQSGGDLSKFGTGVLPFSPAVGLQALQLQQQMTESDKTDPRKLQLNKEAAKYFQGIQDPLQWEKSRQEWSNAGVYVPSYEDATRDAWLKTGVSVSEKEQLKPDQKKTLVNKGYQAFNRGSDAYKSFYDSLPETEKMQVALPPPEVANERDFIIAGADVKGVSEIGAVKKKARLEEVEAGAELGAFGEGLKTQIPTIYEGRVKSVVDRYDDYVKPIIESSRQADQLRASLAMAKDGALMGAPAMAAVFQFMKAMDPRSVVREGEFQSVKDLAGFMGKWGYKMEELERGIVLPPQVVDDLSRLISQLEVIGNNEKKSLDYEYGKRLANYGIHPSVLLGDSDADIVLRRLAADSAGKK